MAKTIYLNPVIKLERKKTGIAAYREKKGVLPFLTKVITSPKTTLALGATLATLLTAGALAPAATGAALRAAPALAGRGLLRTGKALVPTTLKGKAALFIAAPTAYGILRSSPKARAVAAKYLDPREAVKRGEYIAGIIEDPKQIKEIGEKEGWWGTVKQAAKKGGKYGAVAAAIVGAGVLLKKPIGAALAKRKAGKLAERQTGLVANDLPRAPLELRQPYVPLPSAMPTSISPIQAPQQQLRSPPIQNIIQIQLR